MKYFELKNCELSIDNLFGFKKEVFLLSDLDKKNKDKDEIFEALKLVLLGEKEKEVSYLSFLDDVGSVTLTYNSKVISEAIVEKENDEEVVLVTKSNEFQELLANFCGDEKNIKNIFLNNGCLIDNGKNNVAMVFIDEENVIKELDKNKNSFFSTFKDLLYMSKIKMFLNILEKKNINIFKKGKETLFGEKKELILLEDFEKLSVYEKENYILKSIEKLDNSIDILKDFVENNNELMKNNEELNNSKQELEKDEEIYKAISKDSSQVIQSISDIAINNKENDLKYLSIYQINAEKYADIVNLFKNECFWKDDEDMLRYLATEIEEDMLDFEIAITKEKEEKDDYENKIKDKFLQKIIFNEYNSKKDIEDVLLNDNLSLLTEVLVRLEKYKTTEQYVNEFKQIENDYVRDWIKRNIIKTRTPFNLIKISYLLFMASAKKISELSFKSILEDVSGAIKNKISVEEYELSKNNIIEKINNNQKNILEVEENYLLELNNFSSYFSIKIEDEPKIKDSSIVFGLIDNFKRESNVGGFLSNDLLEKTMNSFILVYNEEYSDLGLSFAINNINNNLSFNVLIKNQKSITESEFFDLLKKLPKNNRIEIVSSLYRAMLKTVEQIDKGLKNKFVFIFKESGL
jgi:hypothetical protein